MVTKVTKEQYNNRRTFTTKDLVRFSYVSLFEPRKNKNNGKMEYSVELMIPKSNTAAVDQIRAAMQLAEDYKFPDGRPASKQWHDCLVDADEATVTVESDSGGATKEIPLTAKRPEAEGMYLLRVKNEEAVPIVDREKQEVIEKSMLQSGDWGRVSLNVHAFLKGKVAGVTFYINAVQVLRKGEPLGQGVTVAEAFDEWEEEAEAEAGWQ